MHNFSFCRALTRHMTPPCVTSVLPPVEKVGTTGVEETATLQTRLTYASEFEYLLAEEEAHVSMLLSVAAHSAPHLLGSGGVKPSHTSGIYMQLVQRVLWGWSLSIFSTILVSDDVCDPNLMNATAVSSADLCLDSLQFVSQSIRQRLLQLVTWNLVLRSWLQKYDLHLLSSLSVFFVFTTGYW